MNKNELVSAVSEAAGISKSQAMKVINAMTGAVSNELKAGGSVALTGFGNFQVKARQARTGRNPQTGQTIEIPAANIPSFKPGKTLKDACNTN